MNLKKLRQISEGKYKIVKYCQNKTVLELGCVNHSLTQLKQQIKKGNWLFGYLTKYCQKAVGIDIDSQAINFLKAKGFEVIKADAQTFKLSWKFDIIVASALTDHLLNLDGFFKSCSKHLRPGGQLIIFEDNILSLPRLIFKRIRYGPQLNMHSDITIKILPNTLKNFVGNYGFRIKKMEYLSHSKIIKIFDKIIPSFLKPKEIFYDYFLCILEKNKE